MRTRFNLGDNIIDSRDVITRIEELEGDLNDLKQAVEDAKENVRSWEGDEERADELEDAKTELKEAEAALEEWYDKDEYDALKELENEFSGNGDWDHGETLILDSHFEDYARDLAEDICDMKKCDQWPFSCIDWEQAANELKHDYMSADADGYTYWMRA